MEKRYIICSAVKYKNHIIHGRRHGDAYETLKSLLPTSEYELIIKKDLTEGFVDQYGDFYNREEAFKIAESSNQIKYGSGIINDKESPKINFGDTWTYTGNPLLISEHLFPEK